MAWKLIFIPVALLILLGTGMFVFVKETAPENPQINAPSLKFYQSDAFKISFSYPDRLYLQERIGTGRPGERLVLVLVEDTPGNRDLIEGRSPLATEEPPSITIDVFQNTKGLTADEWAKEDANWAMGSRELRPVVVGDVSGISFFWDGLYSGKTAIVTQDRLVYALSVTWITPDDLLIKDFDALLDSIKFE